ncbi:helix-turn-helix domain-containing protein [Rhizobium ruizarguesonis]|uniref:helix-turn-helix domain-containing protein n=1 Tax=Rhizobium ruizarguesonis TaxID=2081791 RepID=UPI00103078B7|nr:helix-turn-helix transcriptional regulator [Rhizobium ruizarguesonis]TBD79705.1 XRE family transcriptional regulator [Rhizobium ruizarguesonis]TBE10863.1 XRE family transcriptional regulator [Rhizobium ruizarguesonis]
MAGLRATFGLCVKAHRRRLNLTQEALADLSGLSLDMIAKIEGGSSGASFNTIERLSRALSVEPSALFRIDAAESRFGEGMGDLVARLAALSDEDIAWVKALLDVALRPRGRG